MRKLALIALSLLLATGLLRAQVDSAGVAKTLALVDEYMLALEQETLDVKLSECDLLLETCTDSLLRQAVALKLYNHYADSRLMGDESVAVHLYDRWFAHGPVAFPSGEARSKARLFVEFNRSSLLGMPAPVLQMQGFDDEPVTVPQSSGRRSLLYFYDTGCSKCKLEVILLRSWLEEQPDELDLYALYVGSDRDAWKAFAADKLQVGNSRVRVLHAWDPELTSDFQRLYGILQTPRLFLVDTDGIIMGRRLSVDALRQLTQIETMDAELRDRNPVGAKLPSIRVEGVLRRPSGGADRKTLDLSTLRGRPAYLVFYSEGCNRCQEELPALARAMRCGSRSFEVNVDEILAEQPALAKELFDAFDLSELPHIIAVDRHGVITDRYLSFAGKE